MHGDYGVFSELDTLASMRFNSVIKQKRRIHLIT